MKGHWTEGGYVELYGTRLKTVSHPLAYDGFQPWDWILGEERRLSPYDPTPFPSLTIGPGTPVSRRASGSRDQASSGPPSRVC